MNSVYNYLKPTNEPSKNGFDLSSMQTYSAKVGQLIPEVCIETVPNANYRIAIDAFTRTMPLNTASFARIKENRYVCFVPYSQLWNEFNQMMVGRADSQDARTASVTKFVPTFDLMATIYDLRLSKNDVGSPAYYNHDQLGFDLADGAFKLMDMLGYGYHAVADASAGAQTGNVRPNLWRILAYNKIWYNFFRNSVYDTDLETLGFAGEDSSYNLLESPAQMFNLNDVSVGNHTDGAANFYVENFRSQRSISKLFQMRYIPYKQDEFNGLMPDTQFGAVSSVPLNISGSADITGSLVQGVSSSIRKHLSGVDSDLLTSSSSVSGLTFGSISSVDFQGSRMATTVPSPWQLRVIVPNADSSSTDGDLHVGVVDSNGDIDASVPLSVGLLTETEQDFGAHTHNIGSSQVTKAYTDISSQDILSLIKFQADSGGSIDFSGAGFNVLDLVEAQSIQKWRQRALLAGNRTNDNFRAHYGVAPKYDIDLYPDMIGSSDNTIQIQEVVSTADTSAADDSSNLGEIAGKGYGVSDKKYFNYQSNDFGVLMVLYAARPEIQYGSLGLDRANQLVSRNDYFIKEFENNGLEPVSSLDFYAPDGADYVSPVNLGFSPRFRNYKSVLSKVHGLFNFTTADQLKTPTEFYPWVVQRSDIFTRGLDGFPNGLSLATSIRYVNPRIMDSVFAQNADSSDVTDHFMINSYIECVATLPMTRLGLPSF